MISSEAREGVLTRGFLTIMFAIAFIAIGFVIGRIESVKNYQIGRRIGWNQCKIAITKDLKRQGVIVE